jgi:hypothetical protein
VKDGETRGGGRVIPWEGDRVGEIRGGRVILWQVHPFRQNKALPTSLRSVGRGSTGQSEGSYSL